MFTGIMEVSPYLYRSFRKRTINDASIQSLDTQVEKFSPTLGRNASYTQKSRLTRFPGYLAVHMVRFAWKADIGKKAKIVVCKRLFLFD